MPRPRCSTSWAEPRRFVRDGLRGRSPVTGANATYADAQLPFTSVSWALDANHDYPSTDREALLVASADGTIASIDVGGDPFAWRFPGVILGRR